MNPDRKKKIKRVIAREGLVVIGFIAFAVLWFILWSYILPNVYIFMSRKFFKSYAYLWNYIPEKVEEISFFSFFVLPLGYPIYLFIRFIIWALKTLRER